METAVWSNGHEAMKAVEVELCDWLWRAIVDDKAMLISSEGYFYLPPLERKLYEVGYAECADRTTAAGEEQLHLPSVFVEGGNGQGWKSEMIAQKHQCLARYGIPEADAPQLLGVILAGVMAIQSLPLRRQGAMDWSQMMPVVRSVGAE